MRDLLTPRTGRPAVKRYDFRRPDKFSKDQLRTLQIVHESFARTVATYLSGYVRTMVHGEVVSVSQTSYDEFIRSLSSPTLLVVFSFAPLEGSGLIEIPPDLSLVIIDRLLGGPGTRPDRPRELTEIEQTVMRRILDRTVSALGEAWENLVPIQPRLERLEGNPQFVQLVPPQDMVVVITIRFQLRDVVGRMNICVPYLVLEPVAPRLSAHYLFGGSKTPESGRHVQQLQKRVETMHVDVTVTLGRAEVTVRELLDLAPGDVIRLGTRTGDDLPVHIGDRTKFRGRPGRVGSRLAVEITGFAPQEGEETDE
ncbi:MAG: flagellar motor switch protein FliM [Firmicutes bacterium]|nr:flagellar motor switch protein FliM [Bacillota bacterium]